MKGYTAYIPDEQTWSVLIFIIFTGEMIRAIYSL